ncbi:PREDICTED: bidirectional sugar transporter SWEET7b [Theobroma cacao]|uniref:Bidirectional sugar transporter SWEET n=1 Tax=Theobroma cacao TaxID=3641 RepID=A0AB32V7F4_THECC|nr:PREDICTED: bidirectional sugar transporter SWEET7b [Theobroma cacao]
MGTFRYVVGIIGNIISFGLFLSPLPTFYRIHKKKAVEEFQPYPYLCTVLNCVFWMFYGLPIVRKDNILVLTINTIGLVIELIYLTIFVIYANDRKKRVLVGLFLLGEAVLTVIVVVIAMLAFEFKNRDIFVGVICDVFNIIMYASPLAVWRKVIKTKSVEYMPFWLSVASLANGCCWTLYALIQLDVFILISNGLGAVFGLMQLILYSYYYFLGKRDTKEDGKQSELQLSNQSSV